MRPLNLPHKITVSLYPVIITLLSLLFWAFSLIGLPKLCHRENIVRYQEPHAKNAGAGAEGYQPRKISH